MWKSINTRHPLVRVIIVGIIGGIIFSAGYVLAQLSPFDIRPGLLFIILVGAIGAYVARGEKNIVIRIASGALAGAIAGVISAITMGTFMDLGFRHEGTPWLESLLFIAIGYFLLIFMIGAIMLILGALGGTAFTVIALIVDTVAHSTRYRR